MGAKCSCIRGSAMADKKFIDEVVKAHNEYRKHHQAAPLSHAKDLTAQAQQWADHLASTGSFQHSNATLKGEKLGENIAMKWSSTPSAYTGQEVTDQWYSEVKMHTFGTEPRTLSSGHFTQVVWAGSQEIGVGKATKDGKVIVVANYRPAGNMAGSFARNVLPPKDGKIVLPPEPASAPSQPTFSRRMEDTRGDFFSPSSGGRSVSTSESRSVRTYTVTEGVGANKVTKTITEETIIKANGEKIVNRKETTSSGGAAPSTQLGTDFGRLALKDPSGTTTTTTTTTGGDKKKSKPFWKKRSGSNSSDSSPERGKPSSNTSSAGRAGRPQKMADFHQDCLQAHNSKRALHGSPALSLAGDLSEHAQKWAEHLASRDMFQHSECMVNKERVGENIACSWSSAGADYTGDQVVDQWYSEISKHNYKSDGAMGSGHFTQVVWKGSKELGVGKAKDGKGKCIVVCNYRPAGNMVGTYKDNVFPPK